MSMTNTNTSISINTGGGGVAPKPTRPKNIRQLCSLLFLGAFVTFLMACGINGAPFWTLDGKVSLPGGIAGAEVSGGLYTWGIGYTISYNIAFESESTSSVIDIFSECGLGDSSVNGISLANLFTFGDDICSHWKTGGEAAAGAGALAMLLICVTCCTRVSAGMGTTVFVLMLSVGGAIAAITAKTNMTYVREKVQADFLNFLPGDTGQGETVCTLVAVANSGMACAAVLLIILLRREEANADSSTGATNGTSISISSDVKQSGPDPNAQQAMYNPKGFVPMMYPNSPQQANMLGNTMFNPQPNMYNPNGPQQPALMYPNGPQQPNMMNPNGPQQPNTMNPNDPGQSANGYMHVYPSDKPHEENDSAGLMTNQ